MNRDWKNHKGKLIYSLGEYDVIECESCKFKHVVPIPSDEELRKMYEQEYYSIEQPLYIEQLKEDMEWWELVYSDRFDTFEEYLKSDRRKVLDIGSGAGLFLKVGNERGWNCLGIEPSIQGVKHSRDLGLNVRKGLFNKSMAYEIGTFDVIHMNDVLEHLPNPKEFLQLVYECLNPNGILCISVPNDFNPFQKALWESMNFSPWWVVPKQHINYFNFDTLIALAESIGFNVFQKETSFPMEMFLLMEENYIGNSSLGRQCHTRRKKFELNLKKSGFNHIKRNVYKSLAQNGLGRDVVVYARKM